MLDDEDRKVSLLLFALCISLQVRGDLSHVNR